MAEIEEPLLLPYVSFDFLFEPHGEVLFYFEQKMVLFIFTHVGPPMGTTTMDE